MRLVGFGRTVLSALGLCFAAFAVHGTPEVLAQQLSIRRYDLREGLAHSRVIAMHQDRKGYLWFGTWEGLSRFDGYQFTNYDTRDGLGVIVVNAITEDRHGTLWVATNGAGVSRLNYDRTEYLSSRTHDQSSTGKFVSFPVGESSASNRVNAMLFDADNNFWCATDGGLYRAREDQTDSPKFEVVVPHSDVAQQMAALADSRGRLWFGISEQLIEIDHGQLIKYDRANGIGPDAIISIVEDRQGRILAANSRDVFEFLEPMDGPGRWKKCTIAFEPDQGIGQMLVDSNGALWLATTKGLIKYKDTPKLYTTANGLSGDRVTRLLEDRDGNLWIGTWSSGVCKLSGEMIVSFTRAEALPDLDIVKVVEDHQGHIYASTYLGGLVEIVGGKARLIDGSQAPQFRYINGRILQDRRDDWWIGTDHGLFWFKGPELQLRNGRRLGAADGVIDAPVNCIYQAPSGQLWVSAGEHHLFFADSWTAAVPHFKSIPLGATVAPPNIRMVRDGSGTLWLAGNYLLAKVTNGTVRSLRETDGLSEINPRSVFLDSRGWLWVGERSRGVSVSKDPTAEYPDFVTYSSGDGLASDTVYSIAEDSTGRIYLGTFKGLDRLDPATGKIDHFTTADGMSGDLISHCMTDRRGDIWVSTSTGLSKLNLGAERSEKLSPTVYVSRVRVAGEDLPLAETGSVRMSPGDLPVSRNNLLIEFVGLDFQGEQEVRYRYKLEGADTDWCAPTTQRSVNYARLAPGSYRFWVKAINRAGLESAEPAMLEFRILPPIWQRWWFVSLVMLFAAIAIYAVYRFRLGRLIELERVRTRIASDLHDDIGSNLSLIAGLSEMLGQQARAVDSRIAERLSQIASVSRRSVDAMSDIVWAVNPKRDRLIDLSQRMRRFASDSFTARDIQFSFDGPGPQHNVKIAADVRREVFLVFKEGVNNIVRHSGCKMAEVALRIDRRTLILKMSDDGKGFDQAANDGGQGLASMRSRAEKLGAELRVTSKAGAGTSVILKAPL